MDQPAVRVRGLEKHYKSVTALAGIELEAAYGEIFAVLGPNGAGKTTLMEILEGHRGRDAGEVSVLGVDPSRAGRQWRDQIGIVLQGAADFATLTVREVVTLFAGYYANPMPVGEAIGLVELTEDATRRVDRLSGGRRRRLEIALGIVGRPRLLFLDEPTTGFDPEIRLRFWDLIRELRQRGTTILLTTHYLDEAEHLADRIAVVHKGRVIALDTPAELVRRHTGTVQVRWRAMDGDRSVDTDSPTALLRRLVEEFPGEIPELDVSRSNLEQAYLTMIGEQA